MAKLQDLRRAQLAVMGLVTTALSDGQYAALCDFTYNVGARKLQNSTLLKAINAGEHERVPAGRRDRDLLLLIVEPQRVPAGGLDLDRARLDRKSVV